MRVALAQINTTVGDIWGNVERMAGALERPVDSGADLVAFPELTIPGYPPEDLLMRPSFIEENMRALNEFAGQVPEDMVAAVGFVDLAPDLYNACAVVSGGEVLHRYHKHYLPNYGVFAENRYFREGSGAPLVDLGGNLVGGQDELVFDGHSVVFDPEGVLVAKAGQFTEGFLLADLYPDQSLMQRLHDPRPRKENPERKPEVIEIPGYEPATAEPVEPQIEPS